VRQKQKPGLAGRTGGEKEFGVVDSRTEPLETVRVGAGVKWLERTADMRRTTPAADQIKPL